MRTTFNNPVAASFQIVSLIGSVTLGHNPNDRAVIYTRHNDLSTGVSSSRDGPL